MKNTLNLFLVLLMLVIFSSCEKRYSAEIQKLELTPAQKIVGKYKMTGVTSTNSVTNIIKDVFTDNPCNVAQTLEFTDNGQMITFYPVGNCAPTTQTNKYVCPFCR